MPQDVNCCAAAVCLITVDLNNRFVRPHIWRPDNFLPNGSGGLWQEMKFLFEPLFSAVGQIAYVFCAVAHTDSVILCCITDSFCILCCSTDSFLICAVA